ncbi:hypothetical protein [Sinosporangium siamense]|uniref:Uncharacterized protein n=1 Tax=Sinosporangium siamense TaxID=1367973 RepID=A0A919V8D5_9ACTN|nr:hypothetical protein [Sinosporangium siamense]GII93107.1 hypothetical protein Ssi02_33380 [Sinosporangium siamense]
MTPRFGARLAVAITPSDVGKRVTVRRADQGGFRDVVGTLISWTDGTLTIVRRDGTVAEISEKSLVAAKVVVPR